MSALLPLPQPRVPVRIRAATLEDLASIDALQKQANRQVGFMPAAQLREKVEKGWVLVAEGLTEGGGGAPLVPQSLGPSVPALAGYIIGRDQYFKRDDVGIIYQLNVAAEARRSFVGAALLRALFDRAAWGCRLFCCWCAQDIEANRFWEAMGFVPLAFRAGSEKRGRVHIFWQKRIREGDQTTPWWFPYQTSSGAMRADRLVFPIPPGQTWADEMPRVSGLEEREKLQVPGSRQIENRESNIENGAGGEAHPLATDPSKVAIVVGGRIRWVDRPGYVAPKASAAVAQAPVVVAAKAEEKGAKRGKADGRLARAARELRDRWLEKINGDGSVAPVERGKYLVQRIETPGRRALPKVA
jgi:ribosomal protein S18 acetylase RimI-like enzyme